MILQNVSETYLYLSIITVTSLGCNNILLSYLDFGSCLLAYFSVSYLPCFQAVFFIAARWSPTNLSPTSRLPIISPGLNEKKTLEINLIDFTLSTCKVTKKSLNHTDCPWSYLDWIICLKKEHIIHAFTENTAK